MGQRFHLYPHGQRHLHHIALLPLAVHGGIALAGAVGHLLPVDAQGEVAMSPLWDAHHQRKRALALHPDACGRLVGEGCVLLYHHLAGLPLQRGGGKQVHPQGVVGHGTGVDKLPVLAVVLHAAAHTAPHGLVGLRINPVVLWASRREIHVTARHRMLRGEDMIEQGSLIEVGITTVVLVHEQAF